jgi:hypothetical protein
LQRHLTSPSRTAFCICNHGLRTCKVLTGGIFQYVDASFVLRRWSEARPIWQSELPKLSAAWLINSLCLTRMKRPRGIFDQWVP